MNYSSLKYEYIIDDSIYHAETSGKKTCFIDFYQNCGNDCAVCQVPRGARTGSPRVFVNSAGLYLVKKLSVPGTEIFFGLTSDPYQEAEAEHKIMRSALEELVPGGSDVIIMTKSELILRDIGLISALARAGRMRVIIKNISMSRRISRLLEKACPIPDTRLKILGRLCGSGVPSGFGVIPVIPELTSRMDLITQIRVTKRAGAAFMTYDYVKGSGQSFRALEEVVKNEFPEKLESFGQIMTQSGALDGYMGDMDAFLAELSSFHGLPIERFQYDVH